MQSVNWISDQQKQPPVVFYKNDLLKADLQLYLKSDSIAGIFLIILQIF